MNKLSVVIITFNEAKNIRRCLESVQLIADEIVVVDSFSTDETEQICAEFGTVFVKRAWAGYIKTKNFANDLAAHDLIFSIDADEAVSPELAQSILDIKSQPIDNQAFSMNRLMNYCGKWIRHCGWYPDNKVRIFSRRAVRWTGMKVHETLDIPATTEIVKLRGDLHHYSYYNIAEHLRQADNFSTLTAEEAFEKGRKTTKCAPYFRATWRFFRDYFLKLGILDGYYGFVICKISAKTTFWKYDKLSKLNQNAH